MTWVDARGDEGPSGSTSKLPKGKAKKIQDTLEEIPTKNHTLV